MMSNSSGPVALELCDICFVLVNETKGWPQIDIDGSKFR